MFLPTIMLSGFMFPVENMPLPLRIVSNIVPAKWYYIIVKSVMIKGLGLAAYLERNIDTSRYDDIFLLTMAIKKFKIQAGMRTLRIFIAKRVPPDIP